MKIVPSTLDHYLALYGSAPPRSFRAVTALDGDKVMGMAGVYQDMEAEVVFAKLTPELRADKRAVIIGARRAIELFGPRVLAVCDPNEETAAGFLKHFGFRNAGKGVWVCSN